MKNSFFLLKKDILKDLSFITSAFIYTNILGYVFHFYVSRRLKPTGYGEFLVLYSFLLTVGNISSILCTVSVKCIVENMEKRFEILRYLRIIGLFLGCFFCANGILFSPFLKSYLSISDRTYIWITSSCWIPMFLIAVERGFLQANRRFDLYAISVSLELTIRLILAILFLSSGYYVSGAIASSLISFIIISVLLTCINRNLFGKIKKLPIQKLFLLSAYCSPAGFFIYLDNIFVKKMFPSEAGYYASVSVVGKVLVWLSVSLFSVFFPRIVSEKENFRKTGIKALISVAFIFLSSEILIPLIGKPIFLFLFGKQYKTGFELLPFYIICMFPLSVSVIFIGINTGIERNIWLIYLHLISYTAGFILFDFRDISEYIFYIFILNLTFCIIYFCCFLHN